MTSIIGDHAGVARALDELQLPTRADVCVCMTDRSCCRIPSPNCLLHAHECRNGPVINPSSLVIRVAGLSALGKPGDWLTEINIAMVNAWCDTGYTELPEVVEVAPDVYDAFRDAAFETVPFLRFLIENDLRAIRGVKPALIVRSWSGVG